MLGAVARWWRGQWVEVTQDRAHPVLFWISFHDGDAVTRHVYPGTHASSSAALLRRWFNVYEIRLTFESVDGDKFPEVPVPNWARRPLARALERAVAKTGLEQHVGPAQRRWAYR